MRLTRPKNSDPRLNTRERYRAQGFKFLRLMPRNTINEMASVVGRINKPSWRTTLFVQGRAVITGSPPAKGELLMEIKPTIPTMAATAADMNNNIERYFRCFGISFSHEGIPIKPLICFGCRNNKFLIKFKCPAGPYSNWEFLKLFPKTFVAGFLFRCLDYLVLQEWGLCVEPKQIHYVEKTYLELTITYYL